MACEKISNTLTQFSDIFSRLFNWKSSRVASETGGDGMLDDVEGAGGSVVREGVNALDAFRTIGMLAFVLTIPFITFLVQEADVLS